MSLPFALRILTIASSASFDWPNEPLLVRLTFLYGSYRFDRLWSICSKSPTAIDDEDITKMKETWKELSRSSGGSNIKLARKWRQLLPEVTFMDGSCQFNANSCDFMWISRENWENQENPSTWSGWKIFFDFFGKFTWNHWKLCIFRIFSS